MANKKQAAERMRALDFQQKTGREPEELRRIVEHTLDAGKRYGNSSIVIAASTENGAELEVKGAMKIGTSAQFTVDWSEAVGDDRLFRLEVGDFTLAKAGGLITGVITGGWDCAGRKSIEKYVDAIRGQL